MNYTNFKKGDYVVLLNYPKKDIYWDLIPLNYVYRLSNDSNKHYFTVEKDVKEYRNNGWSIDPDNSDIERFDFLQFRLATSLEIDEYNKHDKPCKAKNISLPEKWCVKPSEETGKWFDENKQNDGLIKGYAKTHFKYLIYPMIKKSHTSDSIPEDYVQIPLEEFKYFFLYDNYFYLIDFLKKLGIR